jgi:hypothetical protein
MHQMGCLKMPDKDVMLLEVKNAPFINPELLTYSYRDIQLLVFG